MTIQSRFFYTFTLASLVVATSSLQALQGMDPEKKYRAAPTAYSRQTLQKITNEVYKDNPIMQLPAELFGIINEYVPFAYEEIPLPISINNKPVKTFFISNDGVVTPSAEHEEKSHASQQHKKSNQKKIEQALQATLPAGSTFLANTTPIIAANGSMVVTRCMPGNRICTLRKDPKKSTYSVEILPNLPKTTNKNKPETAVALSATGDYLLTSSVIIGLPSTKRYTVWNTQVHPTTRIMSFSDVHQKSIVRPIVHNQQPYLLIVSPEDSIEQNSNGAPCINLYLHHLTAKKNSRTLIHSLPCTLENNALEQGYFGQQLPVAMSPSWQQLLIGTSANKGIKLQLGMSPIAYVTNEVSQEIQQKLQELHAPKKGCVQS